MASVADTGAGGTQPIEPTETVVVRRRNPALVAAKWIAIVLGVLVAVAVAFLLWLNSDSGRRFVVDQINGIEMASGLRIHVEEIEGSLWGELTLRGLVLSDPRGAFFAAPVAQLDYRPLAYIRRSHVDVRSLIVPEARLARLPQLRSTDTNAPLIPDIDVDIGTLRIGRLTIDPPVTGQRHLLQVAANGVRLRDSAARGDLTINALRGPGVAGGDRLALRFEAAPEQNRLNIEARVQAPGDGFVASMTGIARPMEIAVAGRGDWANWRGRAQAALEGRPFANLIVQAQNGTFTVTGPLRPDLFVTGPAQRLTEPLTYLNLRTTWANRRADVNLRINSRALVIAAEGVADLRESRFETMRVAARLLQPGAIAPNLSGRDVRLALVLDGAFRAPRIAYDLRAAALGISTRTLENFRATGSARIDSDRIVVPVVATASRITGLPPTLGGLLTNVRMNGDILIDWPNILSDNLRIRSDRADAVLTLAFDVGRGRYNVGVQGTVNNYLIQSVGVFDITSDFDLVNQAGGFGIQGRVAIRSRRIFNATAADLLGGNAVATATIAVAGNGVVRVGDVRVTAPALRITEGGGVYYPDGRLALQLSGNSRRYGAISVNVTGSISVPQVQLTVANPGFGVGLRNVRASVRSVRGGYAVTATGESNYGPFSADVVIRPGRQLAIQVNRLLFAGLTFAGQVTQTAAGPFAGSLSVTGQGIDGNVALAAAGRRQRVDIAATAQNASIPSSVAGTAAIAIQRAIIDVGVTLPIAGDAFAVYEADGDVQVAGLTSGSLNLTRGRTVFTYRGNAGNARFVAEGSNGVPFNVAGNADLSPERIRMAMQGSANNIPFRFARPALIERADNAWVLRPTTVLFREGQGSLRLAGRYGDGLIIQSRLDSLDLSIANTVNPSLGIGGQATGSLDFFLPPGGAFPRAEARLNIANFTRTGIATRSIPVGLAVAGNLRPEGGSLAAVIRQNGAVVGRMQARLQPLPPGAGSWGQRLMAAPLSGGIRYNGPASVLTSLVNLAGHHLEGPIGIGADFTGRVDQPQFTGVVRANNLTYTNEQYGTRITNLALNGNFNGSQLDIVQLTGRAGDGTIRAEGEIGLASAAGYPIRIDARLDNARLARGDDISATATGDLQIRNSAGEPALIRGRLELGETRYQIVTQGAARIPQLAGVRRRGEPIEPPGQRTQSANTVPSIWNLDLQLVSDNQLYVTGMGLESEWAADLRVTGRTSAPELTGTVNLVRGTLSLAGRRFILDQQSNIVFTGGSAGQINPQLDIRAVADIDDVEVQILIGGNATNPRIEFASTPSLPQDEVVSRILFGSSVTEISAIQAIQLAASLNSLRGGSGGLNPLGELQQATGIDRLRILGEDDTVGRGTAIAGGFYLSDDIYIEIITDAEGFTAAQIEVSLSRALSLLSQFGTRSGTNVNLRYSRDY